MFQFLSIQFQPATVMLIESIESLDFTDQILFKHYDMIIKK
jgi:hypothetical protein